MTDEKDVQVEEQNTDPTESFGAKDYLDSLEAIKQNTVSKTDYEKIAKENRELVKALTEGGGYFGESKDVKTDVGKLREKLFGKAVYSSDLEYFTDMLELRDAVLAEGQPDPFLPFNRDYRPKDEDIATAERIAEELKACVEYAGGDPLVFTSELQRRGVKFDTRKR